MLIDTRPLRILVLDDDPERHDWYRRRHTNAVHVWRAEEALWHLRDPHGFGEITLDHDLEMSHADARDPLGGIVPSAGYHPSYHSGLVVAKVIASSVDTLPWLRECKLTIHSWNPEGARAMFDALAGAALSPRYLPWRWDEDRAWCRRCYERAWPNPSERPPLPCGPKGSPDLPDQRRDG